MATVSMTRSTRDRPRYPHILAATVAAAAASAGLNAVLRYTAVAAFDIPQPQFEPLNLSPVVTSSILSAAVGGVFFALMVRLTRRPLRVFLAVATVVLALSMIPVLAVNGADPPQYPGAGAAAGVTMALMHVVVAAVLAGALRRTLRPRDNG
jgi:hypothetical protein